MKSSGLVLFVCSGLLLSGGAILGGSTLWSLLRMSYYFWTTDLGVELGSSVLFISGALLCVPACWLATLVPYHPRSVSIPATLMVVTLSGLMLLAVGVSAAAGLTRAVRDAGALNASMLRAMSFEAFDPAVKSAFASMQLELKCCGVKSHQDWHQYGRSLPPSCCGRVWNGKRGNTCEIPSYSAGCLNPARAELRMFANAVSVLACAIIIVKAVTLFATAYTLVTGALDVQRGGKLQPLRFACLAAPAPCYAPPAPCYAPPAPCYAPPAPCYAPPAASCAPPRLSAPAM